MGCGVTHNGAGARTDSDDDQLSGDLDDAFDVDDSVLPKQWPFEKEMKIETLKETPPFSLFFYNIRSDRW